MPVSAGISGGRLSGSSCRRFQANVFNRHRCQHCFRTKESHSEEALENSKMARKVTNCGYLYVAPENLDFSTASHRTRRWQRRWFALYDDGELTFALDQHPETVPQGVLDMTNCMEVGVADGTTGNAHSIFIGMRDGSRVFVKADSSEEIRWWFEILAMYSKRNLITPTARSPREEDVGGPDQDDTNADASVVILVASKRRSPPQFAASPRTGRRKSDPLAAAKIDVSRSDSFHGTPRSVKNRSRQWKEDMGRRVMSDIPLSAASGEIWNDFASRCDSAAASDSSGTVVSESRNSPVQNGGTTISIFDDRPHSEPPPSISVSDNPKVDVSTMHTLRKGWLMMRGKSDSDWQKHWVVLAGLSLKMYKDAWAEDGATASVEIDLGDSECVYPISVSRNYGIEIRCRTTRYILSAMTPGIRDSWIKAIQQNLNNPSPTAVDDYSIASSSTMGSSNGPLSTTLSALKKRRIAYVAPESHHRSATDISSSEAEEEFTADSMRDELSISERSLDSSGRDDDDDFADADRASRSSERRRSVSPITVRRSPVSRVKERSSRRQRFPTAPATNAHNTTTAEPESQDIRVSIRSIRTDTSGRTNRGQRQAVQLSSRGRSGAEPTSTPSGASLDYQRRIGILESQICFAADSYLTEYMVACSGLDSMIPCLRNS